MPRLNITKDMKTYDQDDDDNYNNNNNNRQTQICWKKKRAFKNIG